MKITMSRLRTQVKYSSRGCNEVVIIPWREAFREVGLQEVSRDTRLCIACFLDGLLGMVIELNGDHVPVEI